ncbi:Flagellar biosynthesis protein FliC, partial [Salmonella enterica subsp. enterica serovar Mississippi str. A4-633]
KTRWLKFQNRFNSAITNLGNTVNNLSEARSRIEDSDYATEVSNMSRAQILQQAGTSVSGAGEPGSAKRPLFTALIRRLIHRHVVHNQGSES